MNRISRTCNGNVREGDLSLVIKKQLGISLAIISLAITSVR